jgi:hypothetical protein
MADSEKVPENISNVKQIPVFTTRGVDRIYGFIPKEDITASELSHCMNMIIYGIMGCIRKLNAAGIDEIYKNLRPSAQRHFQVHEISKIVKPGPSPLPIIK